MSTKPYNTKLSSRDSFIYAIVKLGFIKHILEENLQRDKNLEKKRKISREREKFQIKKRSFSREIFSRENSLFNFLSISNASSTYSNFLKVLTLPILPFSRLFTFL